MILNSMFDIQNFFFCLTLNAERYFRLNPHARLGAINHENRVVEFRNPQSEFEIYFHPKQRGLPSEKSV
jgi:hypothetical protein